MKPILILSFVFQVFVYSAYSQQGANENNVNYWQFYPFSIDLATGVWMPTFKLSEYYSPSFQAGGGLGLQISKRMRISYWLLFRPLQQKKSILINDHGSMYQSSTHMGASLGGWLSYQLFKNKMFCSELITGISWEPIGTNTPKQTRKDSITISGVGISIGVHTWFKTYRYLNFGLRTVYTHATYDMSKYLAHRIGSQSITLSLLWRFPNRG